MKIRIKEALELYNFRKSVENEKKNRPPQDGKLLQSDIARMLLDKEVTNEYARVQGSKLVKGDKKSIKISHLKLLCEKLGVDPNFLFGFPSKHDKDYLDNLSF